MIECAVQALRNREQADLVALRVTLGGPVCRQAPLVVHEELHAVLARPQQQRALKPAQSNTVVIQIASPP
jgi:hypothetical protein